MFRLGTGLRLDATRAGIKKKIATLRMQFKQEQVQRLISGFVGPCGI